MTGEFQMKMAGQLLGNVLRIGIDEFKNCTSRSEYQGAFSASNPNPGVDRSPHLVQLPDLGSNTAANRRSAFFESISCFKVPGFLVRIMEATVFHPDPKK